jgi:hypothetical protein
MSLKSELKNGVVVECRNGERFIKIDNIFYNNFAGVTLEGYNEDLTAKGNSRKWDIVKINNNVLDNRGYCYVALQEVGEDKWTWERPREILDKEEKEYLSTVIKPFKNKIRDIFKIYDPELEYIAIRIKGERDIVFPSFKPGTMYKGMKSNKPYMLEELEL